MVDWLCKIFLKAVNFISILILVLGTIFGYISNFHDSYLFGFIGAIIGFCLAFLFDVFIIPPIAILFNIDSKLNLLLSKKKLKFSNDNEEKNISDKESDNKIDEKENIINSIDTKEYEKISKDVFDKIKLKTLNNRTRKDLSNSYVFIDGFYILKSDIENDIKEFLKQYVSKQIKNPEPSNEARN